MSLDSELAALHPLLLRFAKSQLRNDSMAEDVVSEAMLAILEKPEAFAGRSSLRTPTPRASSSSRSSTCCVSAREVHIEPLDEQSQDDALDALFNANGHWQEPPPAWQQPEKSLEQSQFFEALQACVDRLPPKLARVFMMREWLERETDEICVELAITPTNCGVMLYRARMSLRECVDRRWFGSAAGPRAAV